MHWSGLWLGCHIGDKFKDRVKLDFNRKQVNQRFINGTFFFLEPVMKRIVEDIDDFQVDTASPNVTATEAKMDGMSDQVANELSSGARIDDSDNLFMTRFMFGGFPEFSWHRSKRNDSSTEPKQNMRKRFTFFRRFILI
ncbi:hypothetical protein AVEN_260196-1 [Araneus ventricosus]|uniref:Uncharacterized protein n=1 Tax=Araneus ventricosus TaxID=182803 RepID=A0A4Y2DQ16_ARAVE|nr:hypothetical protein AVEN_260196-1 [Araneus ventricosus]